MGFYVRVLRPKYVKVGSALGSILLALLIYFGLAKGHDRGQKWIPRVSPSRQFPSASLAFISAAISIALIVCSFQPFFENILKE
jgi:hypothetical protein